MKKNIWKLINSIFLVAIVIYFYTNNKSKQNTNNVEKVVFIDNIKIFSEFNMTKELTKENEKKYKSQIKEFDSIINKLKSLERFLSGFKKKPKKKKKEYLKLQKIAYEKDKELKEIQAFVKNDISTKVWKRLNDYIERFGKVKRVSLILGAQGTGNIMYGKEKTNLTDEFIKFANNKYEGN